MLYLIKDMLRPFYLFLKQSNVRTFYQMRSRHEKSPRNIPVQDLSFNNLKLDIVDGPSFVGQYKEIFLEEIYKFESKNPAPVIYDCGANVGTSILYFKQHHPQARITAFEADKNVYKCVASNLKKNNVSDVNLINKAVWTHNDGVNFSSDGADGGAISSSGKSAPIASARLRDFLAKEQTIDMLKIDIEGAETDVVLDCADELHRVQNIFIEFHSINKSPQKLSKLLAVLENQGFRYFMTPISVRETPFVNRGLDGYMDLQINIFGYRL